MPHLLTPTVPLAAQQLAVVLRAKRILFEATEVAAGRLVAVRHGNSYALYPARVVAYARQLLGAPVLLPTDGLAVAFTSQGRTDAHHYAPEAVLAALLALRSHQLAALRHNVRRLARNEAKLVRLHAAAPVGCQEGGQQK